MSFFQRIKNNNFIKEAKAFLSEAKKLDLSNISNQDLLSIVEDNRKTFNLVDSAAVILEIIKRKTSLNLHDNQILCAYSLYKGKIAELATGEGKTLASILAIGLLNIKGKKVHVFTANEYLVERDFKYASYIFEDLNIKISYISQHTEFLDKKDRYNSDVLYMTAREACYNKLNQQFIKDPQEQFIDSYEHAIIDEVDYILIEEARSPMSISSNREEDVSKFIFINDMKHAFDIDVDFSVNLKRQKIDLTEKGFDKIEFLSKKYDLISEKESIYDDKNILLIKLFENALKAEHITKKDKHYLVQNNEILIVDENSGRVLYGRKWSDGLQQAIEAKEGLNISPETSSIAKSTLQHYFKSYSQLSGMTGTAKTESIEFREIYGLDVISIDSNTPLIRKDLNDVVFQTKEESINAAIAYIEQEHAKGRPILIGTLSVETSEIIYEKLINKGFKVNLLNAKNHKNESEIIQNAGKRNNITIATNMAGRGTDITLGENKDKFIEQGVLNGLAYDTALSLYKQAHDEVNEIGGLCVVGIERSHSRRLDNQLIGRSGRQGDQGSSIFFVSLEDDLIKAYGSQVHIYVKTIGLHIKNASVSDKKVSGYIEQAQKANENDHFNMRKDIIRYSQIIEEQSDIILSLRKDILNLSNIEDYNKFVKNIYKKVVFDLNEDVNSEEGMFLIRQEEPDSVESAINGIFDIPLEVLESKEFDKYIDNDSLFEIYADILYKNFNNKQNLVLSYLPNSSVDILSIYKRIALLVIDGIWCDHLSNVDNIRKQTQFSNFSKNNPIQVFGEEVDDAFAKTIRQIFLDIAYAVYNFRPEDLKIKSQ